MTGPPPIYYALQIIIPAVIIISGWVVVYKNALKIEARKEARDFVGQIESLIDDLYGCIREYYCKDNKSSVGPISASIKADFLLLSQYLFILKGLGIKMSGTSILVAFRTAATGGYFETADFMKQSQIPGWEAELAGLSAQLKLSVRRSYFVWSGSYQLPKMPKAVPWQLNSNGGQ